MPRFCTGVVAQSGRQWAFDGVQGCTYDGVGCKQELHSKHSSVGALVEGEQELSSVSKAG